MNCGRALSFASHLLDDDRLDLIRLYSSPRLALLPVGHRLAQRSEVGIGELADDPVVLHGGAAQVWDAWHNVDARPDGWRPRPGPTVRNVEEKIEVVATGRAISFIPASVTTAMQIPPEVTAVPVTDIPPAEVCLAWQAGCQSEAVSELVATARTILAG